jgi:glycosyltransferase involved in cell wall biosynthesis
MPKDKPDVARAASNLADTKSVDSLKSALQPKIAVLVPCYNEGLTVGSVVTNFKAALPAAAIYVYDNNSVDDTVEAARKAGAVVRSESRQGKGSVVRRMFVDVDADVYVLADGDGQHDAAVAPKLVAKLVDEGLDFVNGAREASCAKAYRKGHRFGNYVLTRLVRAVFGRQFQDILSGYKVLSRRFVKSFPAMSSGFEIETELSVHALELRMPCDEVATVYKQRPQGSTSKLKTISDGMRILLLIGKLIKDERPLQVFGLLGISFVVLGIILGTPIITTFLQTGLVPRLPTAVLSVGVIVVGVLFFFSGLILDLLAKTRREMKWLHYISVHKDSRT